MYYLILINFNLQNQQQLCAIVCIYVLTLKVESKLVLLVQILPNNVLNFGASKIISRLSLSMTSLIGNVGDQ